MDVGVYHKVIGILLQVMDNRSTISTKCELKNANEKKNESFFIKLYVKFDAKH